jgi:hypothetical protein
LFRHRNIWLILYIIMASAAEKAAEKAAERAEKAAEMQEKKRLRLLKAAENAKQLVSCSLCGDEKPKADMMSCIDAGTIKYECSDEKACKKKNPGARVRSLTPGSQEEKLVTLFGLNMDNLSLYGQQVRDGQTRYACNLKGHEGILYVWSMFDKTWHKRDVK